MAHHALIRWLITHVSRDWSCTDHVNNHEVITWLSCTDHVDIMHWWRACACTDDVADRALITWLIMHWSRVYQAMISDWQALIMGLCTHWSRGYHALITWLRMHWWRGWSGTDNLIGHAVITWLVVHWSRVSHTVITWLRGADHVTVPSMITWLSRHWYHDWACTDHVPGAGEAFHSGQRSWGRRLGLGKCGIEPQESTRMFSSISPPKKTGVCLLYCFMLSPVISLGAVPHHHLALSVKELTYSSNS